MHVMIVEDDPLLSELVAMKLKKEGYKTTCAFNGKEGLEKLKECVPSAIILDVMMPVMDGFEFLKIIRGEDKTKNIPVILFSSLGDKEKNIEEGKRLGANAFLVKSQLSLNDIPTKVREVTGVR